MKKKLNVNVDYAKLDSIKDTGFDDGINITQGETELEDFSN